ncbi:MAG: cytochrome c peroxidase [Bacteroidota bacterium]
MIFNKHAVVITAMALFVSIISMSLTGKNEERVEVIATIGNWYKTEMQRFDSMLQEYPKYFYDSSYTTRLTKYEDLTRQLKRIEGLFIYFHPKLSHETFFLPARFEKRDFGPPFPDNWLWLGPFGIDPDSTLKKFTSEDSVFSKKFIARSVTNFRAVLKSIDTEADVAQLSESSVFEAIRLQVMRMSTIGISNGEIVIEQAGIPAIEGELQAMTEVLHLLTGPLHANMNSIKKNVHDALLAGKKMLDLQPGYASFDRMEFLTSCLIPLAKEMKQLQAAMNVPGKKIDAAIYNNVYDIYAANIFDADFFAPSTDAYNNKERAALGKFLFFDPLLSDNNERACASCHKPELAFTDGNKKSLTFERGDLPRNAPTVINAIFQKQQFWDLRASSLEDQLDSVVNSADELHSSFDRVIERLNSSKEYRQMFYAAFPESKTSGIQRKHVKVAIACYERELTGLNSRFDQYLRGNKSSLNAAEINGFNLFAGKAKCASCHYAPLFNGAFPPYFEFTDHRSIGVPLKDTMEVYEVDSDEGTYKNTRNPFHYFSFKVPTVRNVALTAPYMHNGAYKTLNQVVDFYNHAGGNNFTKQMRPGMKGLPFFMILPEKLNLTPLEKEDLVAFMKALTDTSCISNIPLRLPGVTGKHANLNKRKIGGVY